MFWSKGELVRLNETEFAWIEFPNQCLVTVVLSFYFYPRKKVFHFFHIQKVQKMPLNIATKAQCPYTYFTVHIYLAKVWISSDT